MNNEPLSSDPGLRAVALQSQAQSQAQPQPPAQADPGNTSAPPPWSENQVPLVVVRDLVLFPELIIPIAVGQPASVAAIEFAIKHESAIGVVLQKTAADDIPPASELASVGTLATVLRYVTSADGEHHAICRGFQRFRTVALLSESPFLLAKIERIEAPTTRTPTIEALTLQLRAQAKEVLSLIPGAPRELVAMIESIEQPGVLADAVANYLDVDAQIKLQVLEEFDVEKRLTKVNELLAQRLTVLRLFHEIEQRTKSKLEGRERDFMLRERLKTIQTELGEDSDNGTELEELSQAIAKAGMPEDVEAHARKELKRLQRASDSSPESSQIRTYLELLTELPWKLGETPEIDLGAARTLLNEDHFGLAKVKQRILEYLAVLKLNPKGHSPILCFVGPPGVGKTSLGKSIARATGRAFVRTSLGGVHDESEIRGHRRTYIGALPGHIIAAIRKAGSRDCVMMLDEIDKVSASHQGDPAAALLEVLDPEQNNSFRDNYLALPFDLSHVLFIATANQLDSIAGPLRDRMEVIEIPGYTQEEKLQIARRHLLQRQLQANGLNEAQCEILDPALAAIISDYTREAGVRNLEREIGRVMRHAAMQIAEGNHAKLQIGAVELATILGPPRFENEVALRASLPGVATGLAWTPVGGDILFIEAARVSGSGRLILTGQLGDVMKESAQAALTLVKTRAVALGIASASFDQVDVHVHVPAGAIPKDGPSAGVAMFIALASLFTDHAVKDQLAMTGEISLRGLVLPVGGIKEKVLAAIRAGIRTILLPQRNAKDLDEIPPAAREGVIFVLLHNIDDAIDAALGVQTTRRSEVLI
jgi:ATP-dependent Lon protease